MIPRHWRHPFQTAAIVSPVGIPQRPTMTTQIAAESRIPLIRANRYPRQIIGVAIRLPLIHVSGLGTRRPYLSIVWARPARWWSTQRRSVGLFQQRPTRQWGPIPRVGMTTDSKYLADLLDRNGPKR